MIGEKKQAPFKLIYADDQNLYIVVGYGEQQTGAEKSYPYIVIKTECLEESVIFQ